MGQSKNARISTDVVKCYCKNCGADITKKQVHMTKLMKSKGKARMVYTCKEKE